MTIAPPSQDGLDRFTLLKFNLLARGARIAAATAEALWRQAKPALRVRSGSCGGLDLVLPDGSHVNCPVAEPFAEASDLEISLVDGQFVIDWAGDHVVVKPVPVPAYYSANDSLGHPLVRSGQICFDRLGIGVTNNCVYWREPSSRCQFCSIGLNTRTEDVTKRLDRVIEAATAAFGDPVYPAVHSLIGGGTLAGPDGGVHEIAAIARALKRLSNGPVYVMITPPKDLGLLEVLVEAGVDEIAINVELFDEARARSLLLAKRRDHGLDGYVRSLARCVELFGSVATRSILIVGLEPPEATLDGVEMLASMGVMPILSPFRPLVGTGLAKHPAPSAGLLSDVAMAATAVARRHAVPLGPICLACQGNTLNIPGDPSYRWYGDPPSGEHPS